jgi:hypothetical protein
MLPKACEQPYACLRAWYAERPATTRVRLAENGDFYMAGDNARRLAAVEPCHELL